MPIYTDWSTLTAATRLNAAERRLVTEAATLLGASFPLNEATTAALVELIASKNTYTDSEIVTAVNQMLAHFGYRISGNPGFAIDTNFDVKNANAISYFNGGLAKSLSANTNFDTGTTATIATTKWGVALLSLTSSAVATVTWFTAAGAGYATEAAAIAAMTDPGATHTLLGYVTVKAAGSTWTAGTDALTTGTGGTPANTTNYYNTSNPNNLRLGSAIS